MPGSQGVKVEAGASPALYRNCKSLDKPGSLPQSVPLRPSRIKKVGMPFQHRQ